jgi:hypothetical protein
MEVRRVRCTGASKSGARLESPNFSLFISIFVFSCYKSEYEFRITDNFILIYKYILNKSNKIIYKNLGWGAKKKLSTRAPRYHCTALGGSGYGLCPVAAYRISGVEYFVCNSVFLFIVFQFYILKLWRWITNLRQE